MSTAIKAVIAAVLACMSLARVDIGAEIKSRAKAIQAARAYEQIDETDVDMLARLIWGEARGCSKTEQAAVAWCVLNRVDAGFAPTMQGVITAPSQFTGYRNTNPATQEHKELAADVLQRWYLEKMGVENVGRVLPNNYLYFAGNGIGNIFRTTYKNGVRWNWSLPSPYEG